MADWKQALEAVNIALGAISRFGSLPGVNMIPYIGVVTTAASALQAGLNAGINVAPYVIAIKDTFTGELPSASQIEALRTKIAELEARIDAPLPPREEGEPED